MVTAAPRCVSANAAAAASCGAATRLGARFLDDGSKEGYADLQVGREVKLLPGHAIAMQRGYIHSIAYPERSFFLRITGGDVEKQKTLRFVPDQKRVAVEDRALRPRPE